MHGIFIYMTTAEVNRFSTALLLVVVVVVSAEIDETDASRVKNILCSPFSWMNYLCLSESHSLRAFYPCVG